MPRGTSLPATNNRAACTISATVSRLATAGQTPRFSSAPLAYIPAGTLAGSAIASLPLSSVIEHDGTFYIHGIGEDLVLDRDRYTTRSAPAGRSGKVFVDYPRNEPGNTAIAPYSPRRRPRSRLAAPSRDTMSNAESGRTPFEWLSRLGHRPQARRSRWVLRALVHLQCQLVMTDLHRV
jgi:hypothetical protein